ncbi:MAG: Ni/Fe hydrogenase subunit alpha [Anaerolineaceae bacterium]|jgi:F420-non-reducing hydrogenase large subunit|nr:MAG: Ni/Fe hydrogenase subunit alpha [Anaerolineaceae bacterium]
MTTLTFPLSRIEGHARVEIEVQHGKVISTRFKATEMRGFEIFVQGIPAEQMPVIVPRICGVCSTAHHVAAVKTLEDAYGVTPPPLASKIRSLLLLGQLLQNQATSLFIFTMPDRVDADSLFEMDDTGLNKTMHFELARRALKIRELGTDLITLAGGQFIHPVRAVVGGVNAGIPAERAEVMLKRLQEALPMACELFDAYWELTLRMKDRIGSWGDDQPAYYITSTGKVRPDFNSHEIRVMNPAGECCEIFSPRSFREVLEFKESEYSYAGKTSYKGGVMRANSLARANLTAHMGTKVANGYLHRLRIEFGTPAHPIMLFDLGRGIELVYAIERAAQMLAQPLDGEDTDVPYTPRDGEGYGLVEAPRGPLIHHYVIENGKIAKAEFVIPTVHNMLSVERALKVAAERYITGDTVNLELERAVGRVVRAFDPCIACATH